MAVEMELGAYLTHLGVFSHNPLHDPESLWWVGIWFLLCHYKPSRLEVDTVQEHVQVVKQYSQTLFNNHTDPLRRRFALADDLVLLANTFPHSFPRAVQYLFVVLNKFRAQLVTYYETYKPSGIPNWSFFTPDVHRGFADIVERGIKALRNDESDPGLWTTLKPT
jgi:hypothetical protein